MLKLAVPHFFFWANKQIIVYGLFVNLLPSHLNKFYQPRCLVQT